MVYSKEDKGYLLRYSISKKYWDKKSKKIETYKKKFKKILLT